MPADPIESALAEFVRELRAGNAPNPRDYIQRVPEADRPELEALIDAALVEAPPRKWDPEAFAQSGAAEAVERIHASLAKETPEEEPESPLVRLRKAAQIKRSDLTDRLAQALGLTERTDKVRRRYHELEIGELDPAGVSERVWSALADLVDADPTELRAQALQWLRPEGEAEGAFARTAIPESPAEPEPAEQPSRQPDERDEVDELFLDPR